MLNLPHILTLMVTNSCTANCFACGVGANSSGLRRLSLGAMCRYIDEANELNIQLIVFSGGEPFLIGKDLDSAVQHVSSAGLLSRVVSNAYWAVSKDIAMARLSKLKRSGLCEINFSTGKNHQQFIPIHNIVNGVLASAELDMTCAVMVELHPDSFYNAESFMAEKDLFPIMRNLRSKRRLYVLDSPWVDVTRDASQDLGNCRLLTSKTLPTRTGCRSIIGGIAVDPDESLAACCGITRMYIPELTVGSLRRYSMTELVNLMKRDFMKRWLFTQGPEHVLAWAAEQDPSIAWEGKYIHQCHACYSVYTNHTIREIVRRYYEKKLLDINFQYWLMNKYIVTRDHQRVEL